MKKSKTFRPVHLLLLLAGCIGLANAAPFGPNGRPTQWRQPDGQVLLVRVFGDDFYARTETMDGYTLVFSNNTYFYAKLSPDAKLLVSTGILATTPAPAGLVKHLDLPKDEILAISRANREKLNDGSDKRWTKRVDAVRKIRDAAKGGTLTKEEAAQAKINAAPIVGAKLGLTILVEFPDDTATSIADPIDFPTDQNKIIRFCNKAGYTEDGNTGSVRDYFFDQSLGTMTYTQSVTPIVTMPHARNYYNYSDYPKNQTLADPGAAGSALIGDAVGILKSKNFDFSNLTVDETGRAVATNVFFAGPDSGRFAQGLWPHSTIVNPEINVGTPAKPVILSHYQITNIPDAAPVIGTFVHENGHLLLGFPDLYAQVGEGVGEHCIMGSGNYLNGGKTPSPLNAYLKDQVGWAKVTDLTPAQFLTANLPTTGNIAYRILNEGRPTEFFMVENRGEGDKWAQYSDDKGILIWHVDQTIDGNYRLNGADHYGIALMQADGREDLENGRNRGDDTDLYDLITPSFTDSTKPNARWWSGSKSSAEVRVSSDIGKSTTVSFGGVPPNTIILATPNGGEVLYRNSIFTVLWRANIVGNVRIDLFKAGKFLVNLADDIPNSGRFTWEVSSKLKPSNDYTVRISSIGNPVATADTSNGAFTITNATFPANNQIPYGWFKPKGFKTSWAVTHKEAFEGKTSLVSSKPFDGTKGGIGYRSNFQSGILGFYIKTSTEQGFDFARFYIDGVPQAFPGLASAKGISGVTDWTFVQFPITAGNHTFIWSYEKDDSYGGLQDAVWIDGVTLPAGTQEIAIEQPVGTNLVSGSSKRKFPDTVKDDKSKPITFTIKNLGKSDLIDLQAIIKGDNSSEFIVKGPSKTALKKGQSTTFDVTFAPKDFGPRKAFIRVLSNDGDESQFDISVTGNGLGYPEMAISQPSDQRLHKGDLRKFGSAKINHTGKTLTFTVTNVGSSVLKNLRMGLKGANSRDFSVGPVGVITLDPGDSTVFTVTFRPTGQDIRNAKLVIRSNDERTGAFGVRLSGKGAPNGGGKKGNSVAAASQGDLAAALLDSDSAGASSPGTTQGSEIIDGLKYLTLTVDKQPGSEIGKVQVSSNLVDWNSGRKFTTVLQDDAKTYKVRDNTPFSQDSKRYIRLK